MAEREKLPIVFLVCMILLGALIRLHPLLATGFVIDADEAIVGLMGKHILEGRPIPVFYYGQHYMGSLEAILAAGSFAIFGISSCALKLVPFVFSLALIVLVYQLVLEISNRQIAKISALLLAVPPAALVEWSTKARGGFIEVVFLGTIAFLFTGRFLRSKQFNWKNLLCASAALGIGWWVNNQVVYFMVPVALVVLGKLIYFKEVPLKTRIVAPFICTGVFLIGGLPYWIYNIQHSFISFQMFSSASGSDLTTHLAGLFSQAIPIIWGAKRFWHNEELFAGSLVLAYALYGAVLAVLLRHRFKKIFQAILLRFDCQSPWEMLILFVLAGLCIFTTSSFGYLVQAPRYLLPLYVGILPITAYAIYSSSRILGGVVLAGILSLNIFSSYLGGLSVPGEPIVHAGERVSRDHAELLSWLQEKGITHVRTNYWIGYRLAFESKESVNFDVFQPPHHIRIPEYELYQSEGRLLKQPIVAVSSQASIIRRALKVLGIDYQETEKSNYVVFYDIELRSLRKLTPIKSDEFSVSSDLNPQMLGGMLDGDLTTRWGSGKPQSPGMEIHISFHEPQQLRFFTIDYGSFQTDFGRKLVFDVAGSDGKRRPLYSPEDLYAVRYFIDKTDDVEILVPSGWYKDLWIRQVSSDSFYDWSVAELKLFSEEGIR